MSDEMEFGASCVGGRVYSKGDMPSKTLQPFRKAAVTWMVRMDGPFAVKTIDGNIAYCEDGWIAVDSMGYPYPVAADVHDTDYVPVSLTEPMDNMGTSEM